MNIVGLTVENFLRIEAAHIKPDGSMVVVAGPNEAGKSSLVNALWAALGGANASPTMPVRKGTERAYIKVEIAGGEEGTLIVERVYTAAGGRQLRITEDRGEEAGARRFSRLQKPQELLTALMSSVAFDPEAFLRMPEPQQAALLSQIAGLDLGDIARKRLEIYNRRRDRGRVLKAMGAPNPPEGERPEPVDVTELRDRLQGVRKVAFQIQERRTTIQLHEQTMAANGERIQALQLEAKRIEDQIDQARKETALLANDRDLLLKEIDETPDPAAKETEIMDALKLADERRDEIATWDDRQRNHLEREGHEKAVADMTAQIEALDAERQKRIDAAKMPVEGLAVDEGKVRFEGVPFSQASMARRLTTSLAVGMAQNPKLKILRIEAGNELDKSMLALVEQWCEEHGFQAWIERVADEDSGVGIYISEGRVAEREESE